MTFAKAHVFFDLELAARVWHVVSRAGVAWLMRENPSLRGTGRRLRRARWRRRGGKCQAQTISRAGERVRVPPACAELFEGVDLVLTPTAAALPWPAETPYPGSYRRRRPARATTRSSPAGRISQAFRPSACRSAFRDPDCRSARSSPPRFGADDALLAFAREISSAIPPPPLPQLEADAMNSRAPGRHFLQIPGPTDVPGRVLRAISEPTIDHRGPAFADLGRSVLTGLQRVFQTSGPVVVFPASGTGAWEAALVNTLSPGDAVVMVRTGWFATLWSEMATRLGLEPIILDTDWRRGADPAAIEATLRADKGAPHPRRLRRPQRDFDRLRQSGRRGARGDRRGRTSRAVARRHDLLACLDRLSPRRVGRRRHRRRQPEGADAAAGPLLQRGQRPRARSLEDGKAPAQLLGLAADAGRQRRLLFPYTPATNLLRGLQEALAMLDEEGLPNVFARHDRHAAATRAAVQAWGRSGRSRTAVPGADGLFLVADGRSPRRRPQRRRAARAHPAAVQHEPRQRSRHPQGPRFSDRPSRRLQRSLADRRLPASRWD